MKLHVDDLFDAPMRAESALLFRNAYQMYKHLMERPITPGIHFMFAPPTWTHIKSFVMEDEIAAQVREIVMRYRPKVVLYRGCNSSTLVAPGWVAAFRKGRGNVLLEGDAVAERMRVLVYTQYSEWVSWSDYLVSDAMLKRSVHP